MNLRKKAQEYAQFIKRPDEFAIKNVAKSTAKEMRASGFKTTKRAKAVIPLKGFDKVTVKNGGLIFEGKNKKTGAKVKETVTLIGGENFEAKIKHLSKKKLKNNQTLSIKIGDNAPANTEFKNMADLIKYTNNIKLNLKRGQDKSSVLKIISIVEIESAGYAKKKTNPNAKKKHPKK